MTSSVTRLGPGWIGWSGYTASTIHLLPQSLPSPDRPFWAICGRQFKLTTWLPDMSDGGQGIEPEDYCSTCRRQVEAGPGAYREQPPEQLGLTLDGEG